MFQPFLEFQRFPLVKSSVVITAHIITVPQLLKKLPFVGNAQSLSQHVGHLHHLVLVVVHVEVQLRGILVAETIYLQIDDDVAFQDAVVEMRSALK